MNITSDVLIVDSLSSSLIAISADYIAGPATSKGVHETIRISSVSRVRRFKALIS